MLQDEIARKQQGERLKQARERLGLKQNEAAKKMQVSISGYSDVENGKNNLSASLSRKLAQYLGVNPMWVMTGEGEMLLTGSAQLRVSAQEAFRPFYAMRLHYIETIARITGKSVEEVASELKQKEDDVNFDSFG